MESNGYLGPEDGGSKHLRDVGIYLPTNMASHTYLEDLNLHQHSCLKLKSREVGTLV